MAEPGPGDRWEASTVLWQASPNPAAIIAEFLFSLGVAALVAVLAVLRSRDPIPLALFGLAVPVVSAVRGAVVARRGRVVLRRDSLEVRRVRTRRYPWSSLRSIALVEGRLEVTPEGWVRVLPIPTSEAAAALAEIDAWCAAYGIAIAGRARHLP